MSAHVQLAILVSGALACLVQLFGGLVDSGHEVFHAAPIALLAMIPVALMPWTSIAVWALAAIYGASWLYEHQNLTSRFNAFDVLEWVMLFVMVRLHLRRQQAMAA
jgi:hypothetical protein